MLLLNLPKKYNLVISEYLRYHCKEDLILQTIIVKQVKVIKWKY